MTEILSLHVGGDRVGLEDLRPMFSYIGSRVGSMETPGAVKYKVGIHSLKLCSDSVV